MSRPALPAFGNFFMYLLSFKPCPLTNTLGGRPEKCHKRCNRSKQGLKYLYSVNIRTEL